MVFNDGDGDDDDGDDHDDDHDNDDDDDDNDDNDDNDDYGDDDDNDDRLLEINSSPALGATTSVTSRLCSAVLEDVVKV